MTDETTIVVTSSKRPLENLKDKVVIVWHDKMITMRYVMRMNVRNVHLHAFSRSVTEAIDSVFVTGCFSATFSP